MAGAGVRLLPSLPHRAQGQREMGRSSGELSPRGNELPGGRGVGLDQAESGLQLGHIPGPGLSCSKGQGPAGANSDPARQGTGAEAGAPPRGTRPRPPENRPGPRSWARGRKEPSSHSRGHVLPSLHHRQRGRPGVLLCGVSGEGDSPGSSRETCPAQARTKRGHSPHAHQPPGPSVVPPGSPDAPSAPPPPPPTLPHPTAGAPTAPRRASPSRTQLPSGPAPPPLAPGTPTRSQGRARCWGWRRRPRRFPPPPPPPPRTRPEDPAAGPAPPAPAGPAVR